MKTNKLTPLLQNYLSVLEKAAATDDGQRCMVAPHPDLKKKLKKDFENLKRKLGTSTLRTLLKPEGKKRLGFNDGMIVPGDEFPLGTTAGTARGLSSARAPLHGTLRVIVVMVDFKDKVITKKKKHFEELFFSEGKVKTGSVKEYFKEVSNGKVNIEGEVVGPFRMPLTMRKYANNGAGIDNDEPNTRTMCMEAAMAADADVDFSKYDNNKDGYVDAFVVVHAGSGSEETGDNYDLWSHKWLFPKVYKTQGTKVYSYLTVPEDCTLGVCAHELGHLLFGFPDLYDDDYTSEGLGEWCLMASGSWTNKGKTPSHPCAWCKVQQDWVTTVDLKSNQAGVVIDDVKETKSVYRLWKDGSKSKEYFLLEHRMKKKFDQYLPGEGLLIYHVDDAIEGNSDEMHYKVALVQADGKKDLEKGKNQGDASDAWPGKSGKKEFSDTSLPASISNGGVKTQVAVKNIVLKNGKINADLQVSAEEKVTTSQPKRLSRGMR